MKPIHGLCLTPTLLAAILLAAVAAMPTAVAAEPSRPNIIFIFSDDHAEHAISAYGSKVNHTPHLDRLAAEGARFTNSFVTNSICTPSRACIITAQHSIVNGVLDLGGRIEPARQYLAIEMRKAGYDTAMVGKWHLKVEPNFDYYKVLPGQGKYHNPEFREKAQGKPWPGNKVKMTGHSSDCITDISLKWLKNRDKTKPFFLMHHYKAPHDMFDYAKRYEPYLADVNIPEPANMRKQPNFGSIATRGHKDELLWYIGTSIGRRHARRNYARAWAKDAGTDDEAMTTAYQVYLKKYLRCVKGVDDNLKRLFDYLKATGEFDNTVIMYTGDQGFMLGEHDYMDKRWMYEESQRMPFLVRYPKTVKARSRSDAIIENVDFAPTMLAFAGVKTPKHMQGRSFKTILETGKEPPRWKQAAYYRYWMHMAHHNNPAHFGIRTKTHKLIFYYGCDYKGRNRTPPGWELYDLTRDPTEVNNVYDKPQYAGVVRTLKKQLADLRKRIGDTDEKFPEIKAIVEEFWDYDEADRAKAIAISNDIAARRGRSNPRGRRKKPRPGAAKPGAWIKTGPSRKPLAEHKGCKEISRDATYRISHTGNPGFNPDNVYLLSGLRPPTKPHAFHSAENADKPHIVIRLAKPRTVRHVDIVNRTNGFHDRAAGLTLWVSDDGKTWKKLWQAKDVQPEWHVDLGSDVTCRYLKLGLPAKGTLHLANVTVYGKD